MKLERLQQYKQELASVPTTQWGEVLYRLVNEAACNTPLNPGEHWLRSELEIAKLKLGVAIAALDVYSQPGAFVKGENPEEIAHLAKDTLTKIEKVNWLSDKPQPD